MVQKPSYSCDFYKNEEGLLLCLLYLTSGDTTCNSQDVSTLPDLDHLQCRFRLGILDLDAEERLHDLQALFSSIF